MNILSKLWVLIRKSRQATTWSLAVTSLIFAFVPESVFGRIKWSLIPLLISVISDGIFNGDEINIVYNRVLLFLIIWFIFTVCIIARLAFRQSITIEDEDFIIKVKYGDLLAEKKCKRVICFDECFSTSVGEACNDIKPSSICGQYLQSTPNLNIAKLIASAGVTQSRKKSKYKSQNKYDSGTIVPNGDDLLIAFVPLDESGKGVFSSYEDYLKSLFSIWKELDKYYAQQDVCISIFGAGITRIGCGSGRSLSQQELLNRIIESYRLSPYKLKKPNVLKIICRKQANFSLNNIRVN